MQGLAEGAPVLRRDDLAVAAQGEGGVQAPVRLAQEGAAHAHHVGLPGGEDMLGLEGRIEHADRGDRHLGVLAQVRGQRRLVAGADGSHVLPALAPLVAGGVRVHVATGEDEELLEQLREGRHDLLITAQRPRGRALSVTELAEEEHLLVAAPAWAGRVEARGQGVAVCAALEAVPLVSTADDMPVVRRYWRTQYGKQHPAVGPALTVPSLHAVIAAVRAGAGYSVLPRSLCAADLASGALVQLEEPERPRTTTLMLVQRPGAEQNSATGQVAEALLEAARTAEHPRLAPA